MLRWIEFRNYKILRNTRLELQPFTLIVGPNGSGKTTALDALNVVRNTGIYSFQMLATAGLEANSKNAVQIALHWADLRDITFRCSWPGVGQASATWKTSTGGDVSQQVADSLIRELNRFRIFLLNPWSISQPAQLQANVELAHNGASMVAVIDRLRDKHPERFEAIRAELSQWLPEYDRILFDIDASGQRTFSLRTRHGGHSIPAAALSQGTLFALGFLTLAYLPDPPPFIGIEEPDRGMHPRLLRSVRDALYRLSHPEAFGEQRTAVQVVATSHSPYFLDLFKDHPEEVVIAEKLESEATFQRLTDRADIAEILEDAPLGEAWYSGVLGGVTAKT